MRSQIRTVSHLGTPSGWGGIPQDMARLHNKWRASDRVCWPPSNPPQVHDFRLVDAMGVYAAAAQVLRTIRPVRLSDSEVCSALMQFAYAISDLPEVAEAWSAALEGVTLVWVFIDEDTRGVRRKVFDAEQRMIDSYPDLELDFYVFSVACRDAFAEGQAEAEQFYMRT